MAARFNQAEPYFPEVRQIAGNSIQWAVPKT